jgi:hypothetical protein
MLVAFYTWNKLMAQPPVEKSPQQLGNYEIWRLFAGDCGIRRVVAGTGVKRLFNTETNTAWRKHTDPLSSIMLNLDTVG